MVLKPSVLITLAFMTATAGAGPRDRARHNAGGAVVLDAFGRAFNYSESEWTVAPEPAATASIDTTRSLSGPTASALNAFPVWGIGAFGEGIGKANIVITSLGATTEIVVGASTSTFGDDDYWYTLRYDVATSQYVQSSISRRYPEGIRRIEVKQLLGDATPEIVVALADGRVLVHHQPSKFLITEITTAASGVQGMKVADVDSDGVNEIVLCTSSHLYVYAPNGTLEWDLSVGGSDVVVGPLDNDAGLEIAVTDGSVVDADSQSVQWTWGAGFGRHLATADIDADGLEELIAAEAWDFVWAYDVERELPKWSIPTDLDIGAIQVLDIDGDSVQELIYGDGQWGEIHAVDTVTQSEEWFIANPEHGVTNIAVGDVDDDGVTELLWGAGATSTGSDRLYVADWQMTMIEWENIQLDGPFLGPKMGDLDGDAVPEIVVASWESDAGYGSGRIVVLDNALRLRAISDEFSGGSAWTGTHDLELFDVDGDGNLEIMVGLDWLYDGVIEIYDFHADDTFSLNWTNATRPDGAPFHSVGAADVDNDGALEIVGGGGREHTGADGVFIYVYDYASASEEWHSLQIGDYWGSIPGLELADLDNDGAIEITGRADGGDIYIFDGPTKTLEDIVFGEFTSMKRLGAALLLGDVNGDLALALHSAGAYPEVYRQNWISGVVDGINFGIAGSLWLGSEGVLSLASPSGPLWESDNYGTGFGRDLLFYPGLPFFMSAGSYALIGFWIVP